MLIKDIPFIGCINLKTRKDKFKHMKQEFSKNNINNVRFLRVNKHKLSGTIGCF